MYGGRNWKGWKFYIFEVGSFMRSFVCLLVWIVMGF